MSDKFYLLIIVALGGYILFLQQCRTPPPGPAPGPGKVVVDTDTVRITRTDTVWVEGPTQIVEVEVPVPVSVTGMQAYEPVAGAADSVRSYQKDFSSLYAVGRMHARVRGWLLGWRLEFIPRVPRIIRSDQRFIHRTVTVPRYQLAAPSGLDLLLGIGLGGNIQHQSVRLSAGIGRGAYDYSFRYDPMLGSYGFHLERRFSF